MRGPRLDHCITTPVLYNYVSRMGQDRFPRREDRPRVEESRTILDDRRGKLDEE